MSDEPPAIDPEELLLRRIPNRVEHYDVTLPIPVIPMTFRPAERDKDGLSFFREQFLSAENLARSGTKPANCYVIGRLKAKAIIELGVTLVPTSDPDDPPGHVIVPELSYPNYKNPSKKPRVIEIHVELAKLSSLDIVKDFDDRSLPISIG